MIYYFAGKGKLISLGYAVETIGEELAKGQGWQ